MLQVCCNYYRIVPTCFIFGGIKACLINFYAPDKLRSSTAATITWITQHDMIRVTITSIQHDHISTSIMLSPFQNTSHPIVLGQIIWKGKWPCLSLFITHIRQQLIFIFTCTFFKRVKWHFFWNKFWILKWLVFFWQREYMFVIHLHALK